MKAKSLGLLILALGCGLVASIGITQVMKHKEEAAPAADTEPILVATQNIPMGETLTAAMVKQELWPKDRVPPGSVGSLEEMEGHRSRTRLFAGEPILKSRISGKGTDSSVASQLPRGMRLVAVKVDAVSGTGSLILPGDKVDVLVHLLQNPPAGIMEPMTRTILQDIKVFAVDATTNTDAMDSEVKSISAKTVSLLVSPEQAQKVTLATEMGQVRLVLRSPDDDNHSEVTGVSVRDLIGAVETPGEGGHPDNKQSGAGLLTMLEGAMKTPAKATPEPEPEPAAKTAPAVPKFTMRLVLGTKASEVVLEAETDETGNPTNSGFWRSQETESGGGSAPAESRPAPAARPVEAGHPPKVTPPKVTS